MSSLKLFQDLGLYIEPNFLPQELCSQLLETVRSSASEPALVWTPGVNQQLDLSEAEDQRKTEQVKVPAAVTATLKQRLLDLKPNLDRYFQLELRDCQNPLFYRYKMGSFFGAHRDSCHRDDAPDFLRDRRVSTIIFLNQRREESEADSLQSSYCGGSLAFYGLIDEPHWDNVGLPIQSQPGMLVAFRSDTLHEVKKVTAGERYTIVSWFV